MAERIAHILGETEEQPQRKIAMIVALCGEDFAEEVQQETQRVEEHGGLMVRDGSRRRTPGGVFFILVKDRLRREKRYEELDLIFPRVPPPSPAKHVPYPAPLPHRHLPPIIPRLRPRTKVGVPSRETDPRAADFSTEADLLPARPDQEAILRIVDRYFGKASDLYRRSFNPDTGDVTLHFRFPSLALQRYAQELAAASAATGVAITISSHPHQQSLCDTGQALLPRGLTLTRVPSLLFAHEVVRMVCSGSVEAADIQLAQQRFNETTGWKLDIALVADHPAESSEDTPATANQHDAILAVRQALGDTCYKVSADTSNHTLMVRFFFPDVAHEQYRQTLADLEEHTGWLVVVHPQPHQGRLALAARQLLPDSLSVLHDPSVHMQRKTVVVRCQGTAPPDTMEAANARFQAVTGWTLEVFYEHA